MGVFYDLITSFKPEPMIRNYKVILEAEKRAQLHKSLKEYALRDKLGEGGFGTVYRADTYVKDKVTSYALKVMPWSRVTKPEHSSQFMTEIDTLKALSETGSMFFPQIHEAFGDNHNLYLVTNYLEGGSLRDEIKRGPMTSDRARFVSAQLIVALTQLRAASVIHRDIKPDNIMLDTLGNITLIDFGMCAKFNRGADSDTVLASGRVGDVDEVVDMVHIRCGTLHYAAYEIINNMPYSYEVDIWSFGAVLYEMLLCRRPFDSNVSVSDRILSRDWRRPMNTTFDPIISDLFDKVFKKDPSERATLEELKAHAFFEGVDWDAVASRSYVVPDTFAPVLETKPNGNGFTDIVKLFDAKEKDTTDEM